MGCNCDREESAGESKMVEAEDLLPYRLHDTNYMFTLHSRLSKGEKLISKDTWLVILEKLKNNEEFSFAQQFFDSFRNSNGEYPRVDLTLVAILLSRGTHHDKSQYMFKLFDQGERGEISTGDLYDLFALLCDLSVDRMQILLNPKSAAWDYASSLKDFKKAFCDKAIEQFTEKRSTVSRLDFQTFFVEENRELLSLSGIRQKIYSFLLNKTL